MKHLRTALAGLFALLTVAPAAAQVNLNNLPSQTIVGRAGTTTGPAQAIPFTSLVSILGATSFTPTITSLRAMTAGSASYVYVGGYAADNDGGEGWFSWNGSLSTADNGGTIIAPSVGSGRWVRQQISSNGNKINVKWFGAKGDGTTADNTAVGNAMLVAIAAHGSLYFPATSACYLVSFAIPDGTTGLTIEGDSKGQSTVLLNGGSFLCNASVTPTLKIQSAIGAIGAITIRNLKITNSAGDALFLDRGNFFNLDDLTLFSATDYALHIKGTGNTTVKDVQAYGGANAALRIEDSPSVTVSGPLSFINGQYSVQGGTATTAISISGDSISVGFYNTMYAAFGPNIVASVTIDGSSVGIPSTSHPGTVTFVGTHGESNYNSSANTGVDFLIGNTTKAGAIVIENASPFGHGNGTSYQNDFVKIVAARSVTVRDSNISNLGAAHGYDRSAIRLETTFPTAGDTYNFCNNQITITGALYSDASGILTGRTGCASNAGIASTGTTAVAGTITPTALAGDQNDYNPAGLSAASVIRLGGGAADRNITGLAGGVDGRLITIINIGATNALILKDENASSSATNRFTLGIDITINPKFASLLRYDGTTQRWRPWDSIGYATAAAVPVTFAVGDLLYAGTTTSLSRLADVATGNALISGGVGVAPAWGKIGLTTHVSGTLPVANGGTNCSSASGTCLDNITGFASNGFIRRTGSGTYTADAAGQMLATATNDNASSGNVGEILSSSVASGSAVALTTSTAATVTSITLTPGDWDVRGSCGFATGGAGTTSITRMLCSLSLVTNALDTTIGRYTDFVVPAFVPGAGAGSTFWAGPERFSVNTNTTVYLVAFSTFTVSTNSAYGKISARRVR